MKNLPNYVLIPLMFFIFIVLLELTFLAKRNGDVRLKEAEDSYYAAEQAKTVANRQEGFNRALKFYKELEAEYQPEFGTGKLYFNLANSYYQLEEYPWAILYYYKASALMPREVKVAQNLKSALNKLSLSNESKQNVFDQIFFFHHYLSLPERLQLFFLFALVALFFASWKIWLKKRWINFILFVSLLFASLMLLSVSYTRYLTPLEGVIVRSTNLYRDAGVQYAKATDQPIPSGTKVEVKDVLLRNGKWLKIATPEGQFGYVPNDSIVII